MSTDIAKVALRRALLRRRAGGSGASVAERSRVLMLRLMALPEWQQARGVAAYVGVGGEPETWALLSATLGAGKRLMLPRVCKHPPEGGRSRLDFIVVEDLASLAPGPFGLWEPEPTTTDRRGPTPGSSRGIDLVVVPGVGFDRSGRRLGFGKGYYDRALAPIREAAAPLRLGVCFAEALDPDGGIPTDAHDVMMHSVITELDRFGSAGRPLV